MGIVKHNGMDWMEGELDHERGSIEIKPGEKGHKTVAPHSEVCMHMNIAGLVVGIELREQRYDDYTGYSVQLYGPDGRPYSAPVTTGEGGLYSLSWDAETRTGRFYYYPVKE